MARKTRKGSGSGAWDFFGLNRPQYAAVPEVLLSSLAWCLVPAGKPPAKMAGQEHDGIVYQQVPTAKKVTKNIFPTAPREGTPRWTDFQKTLASQLNIVNPESAKLAAEVLAEDLVGTVPAKALSKAIVPFNAVAALMQDSRGMQGVDHPPNYASIMQRMFVLGDGKPGAAQLLAKVFQEMHLAGENNWFDKTIASMAPEEIKDAATDLLEKPDCSSDEGLPIPAWLADANTPFHWYARAWENLMTGGWVDVMPRRRWVDWASCVLRTAFGAGFVFEMNFYYQVVLSLPGNDKVKDVVDKALARGDPLLPWDGAASVSSRDVASKLTKLCERGTACRALIKGWIGRKNERDEVFPTPSQYLAAGDGLEKWIVDARGWLGGAGDVQESNRRLLRQAIAGVSNRAANNVLETINYALVDRGKPGVNEDYYSMLKKRGRRYTVVEPGQEWFVVISSLQAGSCGGETRVSEVITALRSIGLRTGYNTIVRELERVGLARSSHDADDAIEVVAAF